jgi:hypothetical protein
VPHISLVFGEMWDSTALSPKIFPRQVCLSILPDGVFLLREPHALHQRHHSKQEIRGRSGATPLF